jgi:hypothetical protein
MNAQVLVFIVTAVLLPLSLSEFGDWSSWLARRLARWTAHHLGNQSLAKRYEEEWLAELVEVPGKLASLALAMSYLAILPRMRWSLRSQASSEPPPLEQLLPPGLLRQYAVGMEHLSADQHYTATALLAHIIREESQGIRGSRYVLLGPAGTGKTVTAAVVAEQMRHNGLRVIETWAPRWHPDPAAFRQWASHIDRALGEDTLLVVDDATEATVRLIEELNLRCSVLVTARGISPDAVRPDSNGFALSRTFHPDIWD